MTGHLLLFDFGGTLNSDGDHWGALFREMWSRQLPERSVEELENAYITAERRLSAEGLSQESFLDTLRKQIGYQCEVLGVKDPDLVDRESLAFYEITTDRMQRIRTLIMENASRFTCGIVSNFYGNIPTICEEFEITEHLRIILDSALVGMRKPDPEVWRHAIELAGATTQQTIVIGDSLKNDIRPAESLGCRTVWCRGMEWRAANPAGIQADQVRGFYELQSTLLSLTSPAS